MNESNTKISIIDQFLYAVSKPKQYQALIKQSTGRVIGFVLVMAMLITTMNFIIPLVGYQWSLGGLEQFFRNKIPKFTIEHGVLEMEEPLNMNVFGVSIVVDPEKESYTPQDFDDDVLLQVMISKHNMLIKNMIQVVELPFEYLSNLTINNESLVKSIPYLYMIQLVAIGVTLTIQFFYYLLGAVGYAFIGLALIGMRPSISLTWKELIKIGIYAKALTAFLGALNEGMGYPVGIGYWHMIGMFVSLVYMTKAIATYDTKNGESLL